MKFRRSFIAAFVAASFVCADAAFIGTATEGCTPAQSGFLSKLDTIVLDDIHAGKGFVIAVEDATAYLQAQPGWTTVTDVAAIVNDIIHFLLDSGVIKTASIPHAKAMLSESHK